MESMGPHTFNMLRFSFSLLVLLPLLFWRREHYRNDSNNSLLIPALLLGILLFGGSALQQVGLVYTTVAKVAFLTSLYVAFVPLFGLLLGHRYSPVTWIGATITLLGLYYLSGYSPGGSALGDTLALGGAVCWALHLLINAYFVAQHSRLKLAAAQFSVCAVLSGLFALLLERNTMATILEGLHWALISGVVVIGFSYTGHIVLLRYVKPFVAAIILSLEAVFGALAGYWAFGESWTLLGIIGAGLILFGCVLTQLPEKKTTLTATTQRP